MRTRIPEAVVKRAVHDLASCGRYTETNAAETAQGPAGRSPRDVDTVLDFKPETEGRGGMGSNELWTRIGSPINHPATAVCPHLLPGGTSRQDNGGMGQ